MRRVALGGMLPTVVFLMLAGCGEGTQVPGGKVGVFVSILPQEYFVERVGGEHVVVESLIRPGQSPHNFSASAAQITRLGQSRIYFTLGVAFEKGVVDKITDVHKGLKVVDTRRGISLRQMGGEPDPHVWLNPGNVVIMVQHICAALKEADPSHAADYDRNLAGFMADLVAVDARVAQVLARLKGQEFMVFHPAFGYFAEAYGLKQLPVEVEGKDPSAKAVARLIERAREKGIRVIFVQPQFSAKRAEMIAGEIGGAVVPMNPLARDYLQNLTEMAAKIEAAFAKREGRTL